MTKFQKSGPLKGRFIAEDVYVDTFDSTTYVQYMAEMGGTFGLSTPWKDIHIVCSSAGGLSVAPPGGGPESRADAPTESTVDASAAATRAAGQENDAERAHRMIRRLPRTYPWNPSTRIAYRLLAKLCRRHTSGE